MPFRRNPFRALGADQKTCGCRMVTCDAHAGDCIRWATHELVSSSSQAAGTGAALCDPCLVTYISEGQGQGEESIPETRIIIPETTAMPPSTRVVPYHALYRPTRQRQQRGRQGRRYPTLRMTPWDYEDVRRALPSDLEQRKVHHNTWLVRVIDPRLAVIAIGLLFHRTTIIVWSPNGDIHLNVGRWMTFTTKDRINRFLDIGLSSDRGAWFFQWPRSSGGRHVFENDVILHPDGTVTGAGAGNDPQADRTLRRRIQVYARKYVEAFRRGEVPRPGSGDCLYCRQAALDDAHLRSHLDEPYYVPSLLVNVLQNSRGVPPVVHWVVGTRWGMGTEGRDREGDLMNIGWNILRKLIAKWLIRQFGLPQ